MKTPLISVVLPVYNAELYIAEAIESILNQTYTNFELLILNDASTDKSVDIIKEYAEENERIRFIDYKQNAGLIQRLNDGVRNAKGKYVARMDNDDISLPNRFEEQIKYMEANEEVGVCGTYFDIFEEDSSNIILNVRHPVIDSEIKLSLLKNSVLGHPTVMARAKLLKENEYDLNYNAAEDYELWSRLVLKTKFHNLPKVHLLYRWHGQNMSLKQSANQLIKAKEIQFNQLQRIGIKSRKQAERLWELLFNTDSYLQSPKESEEIIGLLHSIQNIYSYNLEHNIYDAQLFEDLLRIKQEILIKSTYLSYNFRLLKLYFLFPFSTFSKLTIKEKVLFTIKCLVKWKTRI